MRVLLNDGMEPAGIELFEQAGIEADTRKRDLDDLIADIGQFDGLCVRSATRVTKEVIGAGADGRLKIIGRAGVGVDNIDVVTATDNGIIVKYAPHGNTVGAAELAFGLMIAVSRSIPQAHCSLREGVWKKRQFKGKELTNKILGIIGCGRIGRRLSEMVSGLNMRVIGYDPVRNPDSRIEYTSKKDVLARADYVCIHTGGNEVIIGYDELKLMKPTAYLINVSRGNNVDPEALYFALVNRKIAGAALDVHPNEPKGEGLDFNSNLRGLDNVVLTPHLGASTEEGEWKTSVEMAQVIISYLQNGDFSNAVNASASVEAERRPVYPLFIHHSDTVGAFAQLDGVLASAGINIRENPSRQVGEDGKVITVYLVHQMPQQGVLKALKQLPFVYRIVI